MRYDGTFTETLRAMVIVAPVAAIGWYAIGHFRTFRMLRDAGHNGHRIHREILADRLLTTAERLDDGAVHRSLLRACGWLDEYGTVAGGRAIAASVIENGTLEQYVAAANMRGQAEEIRSLPETWFGIPDDEWVDDRRDPWWPKQ